MEKGNQNSIFEQGPAVAEIIIKALDSAAKKTHADQKEIWAVVNQPEMLFKLIEDIFVERLEKKVPLLRQVNLNEELVIEPLNGDRNITDAKELFKSYIEEFFIGLGKNEANYPTPEIFLNVYEVIEDRDFVRIFNSIGSELDKLVLSHHQIIRFCEKYFAWLAHEGGVTLFLTKVNYEYSVVNVCSYYDGLNVHNYRFRAGDIWEAKRHHRIVLPKFIKAA